MDPFSRIRFLLGSSAMDTLKNATVAVFGLGGVGGYVVEALARSGVGSLVLVDHDTISPTNLNRQILATWDTVGKSKAQVARERVLSINPEAKVEVKEIMFLPETADQFDFSRYSYVVDAIDTVTGKLMLIQSAQEAGIPIISSMGTGNKLDPSAFRVADIYETSGCPLARIMRKECRRRGIPHLKVVYSTEEPITPQIRQDDPALSELPQGRNALPGSSAFVPGAAGLILASQVVRDLTGC